MRFIIILFFITAYTFAITGIELAEKIESREKPENIKSINTMILTNKDDRIKTLELISISKGDSKKQMIWFLKPKKDKGIAFLKIEHEDKDDFMTMWLPGFSRFKRIKSSQKSDSFMGSDLSFEDLTNRTISDYNYKIIENNDNEYTLESLPKGIDSEYYRHVTKIKEIEENIYIATEEKSYDLNNELLKTKIFNFIKMDDYYIMDRLEVKNVQKNHSTLLTVNEISLNNNFEDSKFSQRSLKIIPK
jgi:hypothetical protein